LSRDRAVLERVADGLGDVGRVAAPAGGGDGERDEPERGEPWTTLHDPSPDLKGTITGGLGRYNRGCGAGLDRPVGGAVGCPAMPNALTDAEILDAERRSRAALRTAPPTLSPGEGPNQFVLEAQREV